MSDEDMKRVLFRKSAPKPSPKPSIRVIGPDEGPKCENPDCGVYCPSRLALDRKGPWVCMDCITEMIRKEDGR